MHYSATIIRDYRAQDICQNTVICEDMSSIVSEEPGLSRTMIIAQQWLLIAQKHLRIRIKVNQIKDKIKMVQQFKVKIKIIFIVND